MPSPIRVAILDDHQSSIDGYLYRLENSKHIQIVAIGNVAEELEPMLAEHVVDVLLLDVNVPTSLDNPNPYPILHLLPKLLQTYPNLNILIISMYNRRPLIKFAMKSGASGYILKDDYDTIKELESVVRSVTGGGVHLSQQAHQKLLRKQPIEAVLTNRQLEALSLCLAYPDETTAELAARLNISHSTMRNLLSNAYVRLGVRTRAAAVSKARQLGVITPNDH